VFPFCAFFLSYSRDRGVSSLISKGEPVSFGLLRRKRLEGVSSRWGVEAGVRPGGMFASNFPVDKASCSYTTLWNAFKLITQDLPPGDRERLFSATVVVQAVGFSSRGSCGFLKAVKIQFFPRPEGSWVTGEQM